MPTITHHCCHHGVGASSTGSASIGSSVGSSIGGSSIGSMMRVASSGGADAAAISSAVLIGGATVSPNAVGSRGRK